MSCRYTAASALPALRRPKTLWSSRRWLDQAPTTRSLAATPIRRESTSSKLRPRITEPSIWKSIVPRFLRSDGRLPAAPNSSPPSTTKTPQPLNYNPLAVYIVLFLLIGSNAINLIGLKNDMQNYKRNTDSKIELLKDVIQRIHKGEDVDVAAALGTGNEEKEQEWEDVTREIEKEDEVPDAWKRKSRQKMPQQGDKSGLTRADSKTTNQKPKAGPEREEQAKVARSARWF